MKVFILAGLMLFAAFGTANAHPHVWIETRYDFVFDKGKLSGIDEDWLFDEIFSAPLIEDFDHGKKGKFDDKDAAELEKQVLPGYADFAYFTHVRVDGKDVKIARVGDFRPSLENGQVRFRFTAELPQPVDPARHKVEAGFYDETFFTDLGFSANDPIGFKGTDAARCSDTIEPDPAHKIYFGQITPEVVKVTCK